MEIKAKFNRFSFCGSETLSLISYLHELLARHCSCILKMSCIFELLPKSQTFFQQLSHSTDQASSRVTAFRNGMEALPMTVKDVQKLFRNIAIAKTSNEVAALINAIPKLEGSNNYIGSIRTEITFCVQHHFPIIAENKEQMNIMFGAICDMKPKMSFEVVQIVLAFLHQCARMQAGIWIKLAEDFGLFVDERKAALRNKQRKEAAPLHQSADQIDDEKNARNPNVFVADFAPGTIMKGVLNPFSLWPGDNATQQNAKQFKNKVSRYIESSVDPNVVYVVEEDAMRDSQEEDPDALEPDFDVSDSTFLRRISKEERHQLRLQALARGWIRRARDTPGSRSAILMYQKIAEYSYFKEEDGVDAGSWMKHFDYR